MLLGLGLLLLALYGYAVFTEYPLRPLEQLFGVAGLIFLLVALSDAFRRR